MKRKQPAAGKTPVLNATTLILHDGWKKIPRLRVSIRAAVRETGKLVPAGKLPRGAGLTIVLADDKTVRTLNHDFRGKDKATNVLSFPQFSPRQLARLCRAPGKRIAPKGQPVELGDIILGYQYIVVEAKKEHKVLINHLSHLIIHGILHLLGYNHSSAMTARKMERLEISIMAALGLPDPYKAGPRQKARGKRPARAARKT
ncbi:MAG: rRNA maturation RNase YbeY [Alphaproteobacteria bacterium]|nr:rRNA maturation RNase YbeY [Alphaproteobacteria bacterium]